MDERFISDKDSLNKRLAHAVEECGEFLAAAGKTQRFGGWSVNPLIPMEERIPNLLWLLNELMDLRAALERLSSSLPREVPPNWEIERAAQKYAEAVSRANK